jgi:phage/plasmid-like protein (TIGR03299 family)
MGHEWETGFMARQPSWHRLEHVVLPDWVTDWDTARNEARIDWDYESRPVYDVENFDVGNITEIPGWQQIVRDDKTGPERVMSIQQDSYALVKMSEFGEVINACLGTKWGDECGGEPVKFEALMSLYGGRKVIALVYFDNPLEVSWDPSRVYRYVAFSANFDGQGGITGIPTNVRVQCANTWRAAEMHDSKRVGFTIRHTKNWEERVAEVSSVLHKAQTDSKAWLKLGESLALYKAGPRQRETYLKRFLPRSDDMTDRVVRNVERSRDSIRAILAGDTCLGINETGLGLLHASIEWSDHVRGFASDDSYVGRQILRKEEPKTRAFRIVRAMAKVR